MSFCLVMVIWTLVSFLLSIGERGQCQEPHSAKEIESDELYAYTKLATLTVANCKASRPEDKETAERVSFFELSTQLCLWLSHVWKLWLPAAHERQ